MTKYFVIGLLGGLLFLSSCGDDPGDPEGTTLIMQEQAFMLPGEGDSCEALNYFGDEFVGDDVPEFRVSLQGVKMTWTRTAQDLILLYFKIEIDHPNIGGEYVASIDGTELDTLMGTLGGVAGSATMVGGEVQPVEFGSDLTRYLDTSLSNLTKIPCTLTFGGLDVPEDTGFFATNADITLVAIARGNGKTQSEISSNESPKGIFDEEIIKMKRRVKLIYDF